MRPVDKNYKGTGMTRAALAERLGIKPDSLRNSKYTPAKLQELLKQRPFKPNVPALPPSAVYEFLNFYYAGDTKIPAKGLYRQFFKFCRQESFATCNYRAGLRAAGVVYKKGYYYKNDFDALYKRDCFFDADAPEQLHKGRPSYRNDFFDYVRSLPEESYTQPEFWNGYKNYCREQGMKPLPRDKLIQWFEWKLFFIGKHRRVYIYEPL